MLSSRMHAGALGGNYQRPIAPAPEARAFNKTTPYTKPKHSPTSIYANGTTLDSNNPAVVRRNARERNRVKEVNNGFSNLRQHLPTAIIADLSNGRRGIGPGADKKLSKVDTLRMAVEYIRRLQCVVSDVDGNDGGSSCNNSLGDASSVSSYMSSCESSSSGSSPPPQAATLSQHSSAGGGLDGLYFKSEGYCPISYSGSFPLDAAQYDVNQHQLQQQHQQLVSPAGSMGSTCSSSSYRSTESTFQPYGDHTPIGVGQRSMLPQDHLKFEQCYDEYQQSASASDDEEILDYISLWQDDL